MADHDLMEIERVLNKSSEFMIRTFMTNVINCKSGDLGEILLHYYARSHSEPNGEKVSHVLIRYGAQINCTDNSGKTPLYRAVETCKFGITKLLLDHGAYVNAQDENKNTPLHIASTVDFKLCHLLLKRGADPNIKNIFHETPVLHAVQVANNALPNYKHTAIEIIKKLLHNGGNVVLRDLNKQNAIEAASRVVSGDVFNWCKQIVQNSTGKKLILIKLWLIFFRSC